MKRVILFLAALLLTGCATGDVYTYRNPLTGERASCKRHEHYLGFGWSPWNEGVSHAFLQTCVDKLRARGFTERVLE